MLDLWCLLRVSEIGQFSFSLTNHKGRFVDFKPVSWSDVYIALDHIWQQFIYYTWQLNIYCWIELTTRNPLFHLSITKIWFDINVFVFNQIDQKGDIANRDGENNCKIVDLINRVYIIALKNMVYILCKINVWCNLSIYCYLQYTYTCLLPSVFNLVPS